MAAQNPFVGHLPHCSVRWFVVSVDRKIFPHVDFCCPCHTWEVLVSCSVRAAGSSMEKWNRTALEKPPNKIRLRLLPRSIDSSVHVGTLKLGKI